MKILKGENSKIIFSNNGKLKKDIIQYIHFNNYNKKVDKLNHTVFKYILQY